MNSNIFTLILSSLIYFNAGAQNWTCTDIPTPNDLVTNLNIYQNKLVISGLFKFVQGKEANGLCFFDSGKISTIDKKIKRKDQLPVLIEKTYVDKNKLYIIGSFDSVGDIASKNIAMWDGNTWNNFGIGPNGPIYSILNYRNEIYVCGAFDSIGGKYAPLISKWDGVEWVSISSKTIGNSISKLCTYNDELYALGAFKEIGGLTVNGIARWDGQNWKRVSDEIIGGEALIEWNGKLLIGSQNKFINNEIYRQVYQWDGTACSLFTEQKMMYFYDFYIDNKELLAIGGNVVNGPANMTNVYKYNLKNSNWEEVGNGINNAVTGICKFKSDLYISGYFLKKDSGICDLLAMLKYSTNINSISKSKENIVCRIPGSESQIFIKCETPNSIIEFYDMNGNLEYYYPLISSNKILYIELNKLYVWRIYDIQSGMTLSTGKIF